jgi:hypothetical protein
VVIEWRKSSNVCNTFGSFTSHSVLYDYVKRWGTYVRPAWTLREVFFFVSMRTESFSGR